MSNPIIYEEGQPCLYIGHTENINNLHKNKTVLTYLRCTDVTGRAHKLMHRNKEMFFYNGEFKPIHNTNNAATILLDKEDSHEMV